jgi:hypothetical protein
LWDPHLSPNDPADFVSTEEKMDFSYNGSVMFFDPAAP